VLIISIAGAGANVLPELSSAFPQYQFQPNMPGQIRVESLEPINVGPLVRFLEERSIRVVEARRHLPSLEDVFIQVTGVEAAMMKKEKEKTGGGGGN
jgi:ABC-2 type transport system ATP-binding protein